MAIPVNIESLIHGGVVESTRIEFKTGFNPNPIVHSICAFANDIDNIGGGYLVIGVSEVDGVPQLPPVGINRKDVDNILKKLVELCRLIEPLYEPVVEPIPYGETYVIVIWVPGGYGRPYKAPKDVTGNKADKHYYIRKFSSTVIASHEEERELFYASTDIPFDDRPNLLASVDDLSLSLLREHLKEVGSALYEQSSSMDVGQVADRMQLLAGPPEDRHPRNVGILMFSDHIGTFFRYARIEVVDMPRPTGEGMVERTFSGPIQRQLRDALQFIQNYQIKQMTMKRPDAPEATVVSNYPYAAVEEILSNAVYHRSYQIQEPITVLCTPTKMEITSFPGFDRSITDEAIARYDMRARIYRNRRIGDYLKELHLIEGRNTGFPTAFEALERNGSALPTFEMDEARGYLSVVLDVHPAFLSNVSSREDAYVRRILEALADKPLSLTDLAHAMGYKGITKRLKETVERMTESGELVKVPGKGMRSLICRKP